jgi:hypothetical protein
MQLRYRYHRYPRQLAILSREYRTKELAYWDVVHFVDVWELVESFDSRNLR